MNAAGRYQPGAEGAFEERRDQAAGGEDGEQGHLQASIEEGMRIPGEQAEECHAHGLECVAFAEDGAGGEVKQNHPESALYGLSEAGEDGIAKRNGSGYRKRCTSSGAETLRSGEDQGCDEADVQAGDDEHVEGAGAFEAEAFAPLEIAAIAGDHGGDHASVCFGE